MVKKKSLVLTSLLLLGTDTVMTVQSMETETQSGVEIRDADLDLDSSWFISPEDIQISHKASDNQASYVSEILLARHPETDCRNRIDGFNGEKPFRLVNHQFETAEKAPVRLFPDMDEGESNEYPDNDLVIMVQKKHKVTGRYMWNIAADDMGWYYSESDIEKLLAEGKIREVRDSEKALG